MASPDESRFPLCYSWQLTMTIQQHWNLFRGEMLAWSWYWKCEYIFVCVTAESEKFPRFQDQKIVYFWRNCSSWSGTKSTNLLLPRVCIWKDEKQQLLSKLKLERSQKSLNWKLTILKIRLNVSLQLINHFTSHYCATYIIKSCLSRNFTLIIVVLNPKNLSTFVVDKLVKWDGFDLQKSSLSCNVIQYIIISSSMWNPFPLRLHLGLRFLGVLLWRFMNISTRGAFFGCRWDFLLFLQNGEVFFYCFN